MHARIALLASAAVLTSTFAAGCSEGSPSSPAPPTSTVAPSPLPPVPENPSSPQSPEALAFVVIEDAFAIVHPQQGGRFGYEARFLLRETSGRGGATVYRVVVFGPTASDVNPTGVECWRDRVRVPPGGSLDTFHSDAGATWLAYCGAGSGGTTATPTLAVQVFFRDDEGRAASIYTKITSLRQP